MDQRSHLVYVYEVLIHPVRQILEGVVLGNLLHWDTLLVGEDRANGMHRVVNHLGVFACGDTLLLVPLVQESQISHVQSESCQQLPVGGYSMKRTGLEQSKRRIEQGYEIVNTLILQAILVCSYLERSPR